MPFSFQALFPEVPARWQDPFQRYQRMAARRIGVVTAWVLLVLLPVMQLLEAQAVPLEPERFVHTTTARGLVLGLAVALLVLRWRRPDGCWPRPMALLLGIGIVSMASVIFLNYYVSARPLMHAASAGLIMSIAASGLLAVRGVRDLIPIYLLPLLVLIFVIVGFGIPVSEASLYFVYPLVMMFIGGVMSEMLYRSGIETFLATQKLRENAMTDPLTGLLNRRAMDGVLHAAGARAQRHGEQYVLIMNDLDHFKRVNDTWGHDVGDEILQELSRRLEASVRTEDEVCRWGGEEFLVLVQRADAEAGLAVAEKIRAAVAGQPFETSAGSIAVTISLGAAGGGRGDPLEDVIKRADTALYQAKADGRNCSRLG